MLEPSLQQLHHNNQLDLQIAQQDPVKMSSPKKFKQNYQF